MTCSINTGMHLSLETGPLSKGTDQGPTGFYQLLYCAPTWAASRHAPYSKLLNVKKTSKRWVSCGNYHALQCFCLLICHVASFYCAKQVCQRIDDHQLVIFWLSKIQISLLDVGLVWHLSLSLFISRRQMAKLLPTFSAWPFTFKGLGTYCRLFLPHLQGSQLLYLSVCFPALQSSMKRSLL